MVKGIDMYFPSVKGVYDQKARDILGEKDRDNKTSFIEILKSSIDKLNQDLKTADKAVEDFLLGKRDIQEVLLITAKVNLEFRLATQIRNKLVETYQEIMRMQI